MKKIIYMVTSLAFLTACHSTTTTENKAETTQTAATTEQTTITTLKSNGEADLSLGIQMVVNKNTNFLQIIIHEKIQLLEKK